MKILIRTEHLVGIQVLRLEQIEVDALHLTGPSLLMVARPGRREVQQQTMSERISVIVESDGAVRDEYVVPGKPLNRHNAFCVKSGPGRLAKKGARENGTGPMAEENPVRQGPTSHRVTLDPGLQMVHLLPEDPLAPLTSSKMSI